MLMSESSHLLAHYFTQPAWMVFGPDLQLQTPYVSRSHFQFPQNTIYQKQNYRTKLGHPILMLIRGNSLTCILTKLL